MKYQIILGSHLLLLAFGCGAQTAASSDKPPCVRPEPGLSEGACEARAKLGIEKSPYELHKWITCLQEKRGWGSGGYSDAVFFSDLIPEWEKEVDAHLVSLKNALNRKDKASLEHEQRAWESARKRAVLRKHKGPTQAGTMYMVAGAVDLMSFPENRALELGCRVEKLSNKK